MVEPSERVDRVERTPQARFATIHRAVFAFCQNHGGELCMPRTAENTGLAECVGVRGRKPVGAVAAEEALKYSSGDKIFAPP
mmetsp:Transcript_33173/g.77541  ORF Transcript_33173/g.77541 Transcript_33173/m.77541 type:complete len:82 (-) Transcript_33173:79-324(-)